ncbi:MAG: hypothetical protein NT062_38700, partial [Proteobacteria bacterium]|nr:hypothetical protein [Pseudomonadota bacterium]
MRLHEVELTYYDPHADRLVNRALDDNTSPKTEAHLLREAEKIYNTCRVVIRTGTCNVRAGVVAALRR